MHNQERLANKGLLLTIYVTQLQSPGISTFQVWGAVSKGVEFDMLGGVLEL